MESVSKMLGHTNIRTTQIYARITNKTVSYTHLDVYKRQERDVLHADFMRAVIEAKVVTVQRDGQLVDITTVSYTHLTKVLKISG